MNSTVFPNIRACTANLAVIALPENKVVVLSIDKLRLVLPQADIRTVESISDVVIEDKMPKSVGWIKYQGQRWPVLCFSDELAVLNEIPGTRRACVMLALNGAYLGLLCDDARVLVNFVQQSFAVPASMQAHASPLTGLIQYEQGLACLSDARHLHTFVNLASLVQAEEVD
jgi:chemotaxis signal transduction protein